MTITATPKTSRCDKCGHRRVLVMRSPIIDRDHRTELRRDLYRWCLPCARLRHPSFTPQPTPKPEPRRPWFETYCAPTK